MTDTDKAQRYAALVRARKSCRACPGLVNPSDVDGGHLDSDRIGPYSRWQGNLHADLLIVGQDFADVDGFRELHGWPGEHVRTNSNLVELLRSAETPIEAPQRGSSDDRHFLTNAVLCLKDGGMSAAISRKHLRACGVRFLRPLVELIAPRAIVTLGTGALDALLEAFGTQRGSNLSALLEQKSTFDLPGGARVFPMWHPGPIATASRSLDRQRLDWERLGAWLRGE